MNKNIYNYLYKSLIFSVLINIQSLSFAISDSEAIKSNPQNTLCNNPAISVQPVDLRMCQNDDKNNYITVAATGDNLTYQWKVSTDNVNFTDLTNSSPYNIVDGTVTIVNPTVSLSNTYYKVIITGTCGSPVTSNSVKLTVDAVTSFPANGQPLNVELCEGQSSGFRVKPVGSDLTYQWFVDKVDGLGFVVATEPGNKTDSITVGVVTANMELYAYKVTVTGRCGSSATSQDGNFIVDTPPSIVSYTDTYTGCEGQSATFSVQAGGTPINYQWQVNTGSGIFQNVPVGGNSFSYTISNISSNMNNYQYRAVVSSAGACTSTATSTPGRLIIATEAVINSLPSPDVCEGSAFDIQANVSNVKKIRWLRNGNPLVNGFVYQGVNSTKLTVVKAQKVDLEAPNVITIEATGYCSNIVTQDVALNFLSPDITISNSTKNYVCSGTPVNISFYSTNQSKTTYIWTADFSTESSNTIIGANSINTPVSNTKILDKVINKGDRDGQVKYSITPILLTKTGSECKGNSVDFIQTVYSPTPLSMQDIYTDVCPGGHVIIKTNNYNNILGQVPAHRGDYKWTKNFDPAPYFGLNQDYITYTSSGYNDSSIVTVTFTDLCGMPHEASTKVYPIPKANITVDTVGQYMCATFGNTWTVKNVGPSLKIDSYVWKMGDKLLDSTITSYEDPNNYYIYSNPGKYNLHVDAYYRYCKVGEFDTDYIMKDCRLKTYNVFTPNLDGSNDIWFLENIENYPKSRVEIYNRYGQIVWTVTGYNNDIIGKNFSGYNNDGNKLEDGVYYYIINLNISDQNQQITKGFLTILSDIK